MAKSKSTEGTKSQREKFIETARKLGANGDEDSFRQIVRKVATASVSKTKKPDKPKT